jgi:hypothetical protein
MFARRLCAITACIIVLLAISGTAWGDSAKPKQTEQLEIKQPGLLDLELTFEPSPWPVWRGDAARTGRSKLKGPGASLLETASVDLFDKQLTYTKKISDSTLYGPKYKDYYLVIEDREAAFYELRVGPGNNLIFEYDEQDPHYPQMFSYDMSSGEKWGVSYSSPHSIALDSRGRIYDALSYVSVKLRCWDRDGNKVWVTEGPPIYKPSVITIGERLYAGLRVPGTGYTVSAFDLDGTILWTSETFSDRTYRLAEDAQENVYFVDDDTVLYKLNADGTTAWEIQPPASGSGDYPGCREWGPICGNDGRVWVTVPYHPGSMRGSSLPWSVFNNDGTTYKDGMHGKDKIPMRACYGGNDRLYIAYKTPSLACFEDWDEEVWSIQLSANGEVLDMVMDSDNMIYLIYTAWGVQSFGEACYLAVIDPSDGTILKNLMVDVEEKWCNAHSELAIGAGGKLFYLNAWGFLKQFSSLQILKGETIEIRGDQ